MRMQFGFTTESASNIDLLLAKHVTQKLIINSECIPDECFTSLGNFRNYSVTFKICQPKRPAILG